MLHAMRASRLAAVTFKIARRPHTLTHGTSHQDRRNQTPNQTEDASRNSRAAVSQDTECMISACFEHRYSGS